MADDTAYTAYQFDQIISAKTIEELNKIQKLIKIDVDTGTKLSPQSMMILTLAIDNKINLLVFSEILLDLTSNLPELHPSYHDEYKRRLEYHKQDNLLIPNQFKVDKKI